MAPSKLKLRVKKRDGGEKSSKRLVANASPDSKCPICLDGFNNVASLDLCLHQFCFRCIHEWSKNKAECPLCKQPFHSIFHSVKGENDFKEFVLPQVENGAPPNVASATPTERVLRPRALRGRERPSDQLQPAAASSSSPVDDDVMFGGLSNVAALTDNRDVQRMVLRLTARRRGRGEGQSLRRLRDQDVVAFRRALYRTGVRVRNTRDAGRQRDVSAAFLRQNPVCLRRLLPWLQRELTVLYGSHGSLVNIVQHVVMSRITNYNMEEPAIRDELRPFLLARTDHFLHELVNFARSTLSMEAYDQQAIYDCPAPSYEEGSGSDSSVIAISEDEDHDSEDNVTENSCVVQENLPPAPTATQSLLSESAWEDETPGPSYSSLLPSSCKSHSEEPSVSTAPPPEQTTPAASVNTAAGPGAGDEEEEEEECLIVGYVKPMAERTPELVQLSSDSSEEEQEGAAMDATASVTNTEGSQTQLLTPSHINPLSPVSSHGPAPPCSPLRIPLDTLLHQSHNRERVTQSWDHHSLHHLQLSGFSGHKRHQHPVTQKHAGAWEPSQPTKGHDGSFACSPMSWSSQSPATSLCSESDGSPSRNDSSSENSQKRLYHVRESSSCWDKERGRKKRSHSPDSDSLIGSHHPSSRSEAQRSRKRHRRSFSSRSADSFSERFDKPSGKRKYKTRHLERAAQRQQGEGSVARDKHKQRQHSGGKQALSRSPSVEIIYERKATDLHHHKSRKRRKRKREECSPTVITIDSDSDLTIDCLDRVLDVIDQSAADVSDDHRVGVHVIQNTGNASALSSTNSVLDASVPVTLSDLTAVSPDNMQSLDIVDHSSSELFDCTQNISNNIVCADKHSEAVSGPLLSMVSMTTTPPSDTRLLESTQQDLEEFPPGVEQEAELDCKCPQTPSQQKNAASPQQDETIRQGDLQRHKDICEQQDTQIS